jgi:hypothetical protein
MKSVGRMLGVNALMKNMWALLALSAALVGCATLPDDGKDAKVMRFTNLNDYRYCELFLIGGDAITKDLKADFYNSTELNGATAINRDSCPQAVWDKVDPEAVKKQYHVLGVLKNGPRYWLDDWIELPVGTERDFNGYHGRWFGKVDLPKEFGKKGSTYYKTTTVHRASIISRAT